MESSGLMENLNLLFRWIHVAAGIMWIGHLWFFNFVNAQLAKTYDADSKKKVLPELMPRALYWFRWGAAYTFITGILLLGLVYYQGGTLITEASPVGVGVGTAIGLGTLVVAFAVYDFLWKSPLAKNEMVGAAISLVLTVAVAVGLGRIFSGRAVLIHIGSMFGTIMAANVWMRIWPAQRKIIAGVKGTGPAPDASVPAIAGLRSKHNTYMSIPLVFFMISNHYTQVTGMMGVDHDIVHDYGWAFVAGFVIVGWAAAKRLYTMSAGDSPKAF
jgi:uncharacterized membrane protein